jgi:hypothetical protein
MSPRNKRGRPRMNGERFPNGQIKHQTFTTATQWQRMRSVSRDGLLSTQLGRLAFLSELSAMEAATGHRIAQIVNSFSALGRTRHPRSPSLEIGLGKSPDTTESETEIERKQAAIRWMTKLDNELTTLSQITFPSLKREVLRLCVEDAMPTAACFPFVRRALAALAAPLGVKAAMAGRRHDSPQRGRS